MIRVSSHVLIEMDISVEDAVVFLAELKGNRHDVPSVPYTSLVELLHKQIYGD